MKEIAIINPSEFGIEEKQANELYGNLPQLREERHELEKQFNEVIKMDIEQPLTWKTARELRLLIQKNRTQGIDIWHKNAKDYFLKGGQFVDAIKRKEVDINKRMESDLEEIEKYEQIQEEKRLAELQEQRVKELLPYVENASELNLSSMECDVWEAYFQTKKKAFEDEQKRIEEERQAEEERQIKLALHNERKNSILDLWQFVPAEVKNIDFSEIENFEDFVKELKNSKSEYDKEQEAIKKENERLQKEAELRKARDDKRNKELQPYIIFIRDYSSMLEMSEKDYEKEFSDIKKGAEQHWEHERQEQIKRAKEEQKRFEEYQKERKAFEAEKAEKERIEKELKARQEAEEKEKAENEAKLQAELNKGDSDKVKDLIADLESLKSKYEFKSHKNKKMYQDVKYLLDKIVTHIQK